MAKKRAKYSAEFKLNAVSRMAGGSQGLYGCRRSRHKPNFRVLPV
jgi:hypothetical protein